MCRGVETERLDARNAALAVGALAELADQLLG